MGTKELQITWALPENEHKKLVFMYVYASPTQPPLKI